ncbi:MAG: 1-acyl-sn-glycerol-3-phosphate acyltransferase [Candidatus Latescibacterota bacterium]|nr:MAG: 1-acyl-sn-glycerol-3-phosphate acyltransferase [Candidatus Latescibacterota bacterium]
MKPLYRVSRTGLSLLFRLAYGFRAVGVERIPRAGGMILAVNHVSYADPVIAGLGVPRELHFFAKRELFRNPLFGRLIRAHNALPVDRGGVERGTLQEVVRLLEAGGALLVFPEGTRSLDGTIGEARPGVGMMAVSASVPIVPAYLRGTARMRRSVLRRGALAVFFGEPIDPADFPAESRKERYRRIGEETMRRIRDLAAKNA